MILILTSNLPFPLQECGSYSDGDVDWTETIPHVQGKDECHIWTWKSDSSSGEANQWKRIFASSSKLSTKVYCLVSSTESYNYFLMFYSIFISKFFIIIYKYINLEYYNVYRVMEILGHITYNCVVYFIIMRVLLPTGSHLREQQLKNFL